MKYIFLSIFVLLAAQPFQASSCDMHDAQDTVQSQHAGMHGNGQDMNMDMDMDCCDHDPSDTSDNCDSLSHCGASASGVVTIDSSVVSVAYASDTHHTVTDSGHLLSQFTSPPFRPPIA